MKKLVGCMLATCLIIGSLGFAFPRVVSYLSGGETVDEAQASDAAAEDKKATDASETTDAEAEEATGGSDVRDGVDYGTGNEEDTFVIPNSRKDEFKNEQMFSIRAVQFGDVVSQFPDRRFNWESYSRFTKLRKEATGMTDAAAMPIEGNSDEEKYQNWLCRTWGDPALAVAVAKLFVDHFEFEDGTPLSDIVTDLKVFVDEDDAAIQRAKDYVQVNAEYGRLRNFPDSNAQKKAAKDKMENLELQGLGVERWLRAVEGQSDEAEVNDDYVAYFMVLYNVIESFDLVGTQNVYSSVNYCLPISGNDTEVQLQEATYQEQDQPALVFAMVNKNGKVSLKWAADIRDSRPLKVLEWSKNPNNPKNQPKKATTTTTVTPPNTDAGIGTPVSDRDKPKDDDTPSDDTPKDDTPSDGNGRKDQKEGSAQQKHAPRNSGTQPASDGDGAQTEEPQQPNNTVVEGSTESGRRQVTDYNPGYTTGPATNGTTETTDTSSREADGATDSTGAVVDNQINSQNSVVEQASRIDATPSGEAQAGFTADDIED